MKRTQSLLISVLLGVASIAASPAWADHGHGYRGGPRGYPPPRYVYRHHDRGVALGAGLLIGSALVWAATRPPTVVYREPAPIVMVPPPVYVAPPPPPDGWWYFCRANETYYPYTPSCPGGWERVAPH